MNYLVYLHSLGFTHKNLHKIFENNYDYEAFFNNLSFENLKKFIENESQIQKVLDLKSKLDIKKLDEKIKKLQVKLITIHDKNYPEKLKNISNPPYFLYVRWELNWSNNFFSIVGSRKNSQYAKKVWESIIPDLTKYFTIVSGWAWGCDTLAHKICVENEEKTIVVFWTGIDITYPSSNKNLFEKVIEIGWALVSIFPIWTPGWMYTFPVRNEIVSGMSSWLLILEAAEKSGTLITANLALDQWKDLFAIPWDIFQFTSLWTNNLIKKGEAKLTTSSVDILEEYNYKVLDNKKEIVLENDIQKSIYELLKYNLSLSIDDLIEKTGVDYWALSLNLSLMELNWVIKKDMFWKYGI